jgi:hypothetical protein
MGSGGDVRGKGMTFQRARILTEKSAYRRFLTAKDAFGIFCVVR